MQYHAYHCDCAVKVSVGDKLVMLLPSVKMMVVGV